MLPFPQISPIAFALGPLKVTWYGLSYAVAILLAWKYILFLAKKHSPSVFTRKIIDDFLVWSILGIILGGRLGYVFFYKPMEFLSDPFEILYTWRGGMSFHGGLIGVLLAAFLFSSKKKVPFLTLIDFLACAAPIGLFLGRLSNFINGELFGRVTNVPWAVAFPTGGFVPRHPSQLYEAILEGPILFMLLYFISKKDAFFQRHGFISGVFLIGYGVFRCFVEFFRSPDPHLGFFFQNFTWGQILCLPMILAGVILLKRSKLSNYAS